MVRRVALLGATGSIGRQAIEGVAAHPNLRLCALQSGSTPLDEPAAGHGGEQDQGGGSGAALQRGVDVVAVGGGAVELLERCDPDVVLNAVVGFAGVEATLCALEAGVT